MGRVLVLLFALLTSASGYLFLNSHPTHAPLAGARSLSQRARSREGAQLTHPGNNTARFALAARDDSPPRAGRAHAIRRKLPTLSLPAVLPARTVDVPILMYHHVSSIAAATDLNYGLTVTDADLSSQLA